MKCIISADPLQLFFQCLFAQMYSYNLAIYTLIVVDCYDAKLFIKQSPDIIPIII